MESTPLKPAPEGPPADVSRSRLVESWWLRVSVGIIVVCALAVSGAVWSGVLPGVPLRAGPLHGIEGVSVNLPVRPGDTGMVWGVLVLKNLSGPPIVLDSVEVAENPEQLPLLRQPYIWDDSRTKILGFNGVDAYQLPLPAKWNIPPKRQVSGFTLKSISSEPGKNGEGSAASEPGYEGEPIDRRPTANVMFEFAPPKKPTKVQGITVDYHIGSRAYRRTFDNALMMCPIDDMAPCEADAG